jgi:hypothetical protein
MLGTGWIVREQSETCGTVGEQLKEMAKTVKELFGIDRKQVRTVREQLKAVSDNGETIRGEGEAVEKHVDIVRKQDKTVLNSVEKLKQRGVVRERDLSKHR